MSDQQQDDVYTHGHHESVVRAHASRTAENSAAFVIPHLTRGVSVLDVGCGPGSITCDFAGLVAPGQVTGLDRSPEVIALAAERGVQNATFVAGNIYDLDFEDEAGHGRQATACSVTGAVSGTGTDTPRTRRRLPPPARRAAETVSCLLE